MSIPSLGKLAALAAAATAAATAAAADWSGYAKSFTVAFPGYAGTETLTNFPVLVRLSPELVPGFDYADFALSGGADLRFADADGNPIPSEIDLWDESGVSTVWVRIPSLDAATTVVARYGCAAPAAVDPAAVWSNGYAGVWHLGESAVPARDSTGICGDFDGASSGTVFGAAGIAGKAVDFISGDDPAALSLASGDAAGGSDAFTLELWARHDADWATFCRLLRLPGVYDFYEDETTFQLQTTFTGGGIWFVWNKSRMSLDGWNNFAIAYDKDASVQNHNAFLYLNGSIFGKQEGSGALASAQGASLVLGNVALDDTNGRFPGRIDELRISSVARSADWLRASHDTVADECFAVCTTGATPSAADFAHTFSVRVTGYTAEETLSGFPLLVRLSPELVPGFDYGGFALSGGADLRFFDADGTSLPCEIEDWNTNGESSVWVKIPALANGATVVARYGCRNPGANDPRAVWSEGFAAVWHMAGSRPPFKDSTGAAASFAIDAAGVDVNAYGQSGAAGTAVDFRGSCGIGGLRTEKPVDLSAISAFTFEYWTCQTNASSTDRYIMNFDIDNGSRYPARFWEREGTARYYILFDKGESADDRYDRIWGNDSTTAAMGLSGTDVWNHVAYRQNLGAGLWNRPLEQFLDGVQTASVDCWIDSSVGATLASGATSPVWIGNYNQEWSNAFDGLIDEVRISSVARSDAWLKATRDTIASRSFVTCSAVTGRFTLIAFR